MRKVTDVLSDKAVWEERPKGPTPYELPKNSSVSQEEGSGLKV